MKKMLLTFLLSSIYINFLFAQNKCEMFGDILPVSKYFGIRYDVYESHTIKEIYFKDSILYFDYHDIYFDEILTNIVEFNLYRKPTHIDDMNSYFVNGTIKGVFLEGKKEGFWRKFNKNMKLIVEETYYNNLLHGTRSLYSKDGKELHTSLFINGSGLYREYYSDVNQLFFEGYLEHDKRTGSWKYFYKDGDCFKVENYKNGLLHGEYIVLDSLSNGLYRTKFYDGTGYYKNYNESAELIEEGQLTNGYKTGEWRKYSYYIDLRDDIRKQSHSKRTYKMEDKKTIELNNVIDVFYIDTIPFYIIVFEKS